MNLVRDCLMEKAKALRHHSSPALQQADAIASGNLCIGIKQAPDIAI